MVDEAFADVSSEPGAAKLCEDYNVIVLKSFGKFFGLAGLRLGFAIANRKMAARIAAHLGPWAVSGPALEIGTRALGDTKWQTASRERLAQDAKALDEMLIRAGLKIEGGTDLYRLAQTGRAQDLYIHLLGQGIVVRSFAYHPHWLRFGIPASPDQEGLTAALESFVGT